MTVNAAIRRRTRTNLVSHLLLHPLDLLSRLYGDPDPKHINTPFIERYNLTVRMTNRRFTRLTNAFSKKFRNHELMIAIQTVHYNYVKWHKTLRCTQAMAAGLTNTLWNLEDLVKALEQYQDNTTKKRGPYKKREDRHQ